MLKIIIWKYYLFRVLIKIKNTIQIANVLFILITYGPQGPI